MATCKLITISLLVLVFLNLNYLFAQASTELQLERKNGVVKIEALKDNDVVETGTGIIIGFDDSVTYILTASHVVENSREISVEFFKRPTKIKKAEVLFSNDFNDVAAIFCEGATFVNTFKSLPITDFYSSGLETAEVYAIGNPGDNDWALTKGFLIRSKDISKIGFSGDAANPGNSGGPLLNSKMEFIGLINEKAEDKGIALRAYLVFEMIKLWNINPNKLNIQNRSMVIEGPVVEHLDTDIGRIVFSKLSPDQFILANGRGWVLADGREVEGSLYEKITNNIKTPDLRDFFKSRNVNDNQSSKTEEISSSSNIIHVYIKID